MARKNSKQYRPIQTKWFVKFYQELGMSTKSNGNDAASFWILICFIFKVLSSRRYFAVRTNRLIYYCIRCIIIIFKVYLLLSLYHIALLYASGVYGRLLEVNKCLLTDTKLLDEKVCIVALLSVFPFFVHLCSICQYFRTFQLFML